jgi:hypothetical protein
MKKLTAARPRRIVAISAVILAFGAASAYAQQINPQRVASCQIAVENLRERVQPETEAHAGYDAQAEYWAGKVAFFVPDAAQREALLVEGRGALSNALAQQSSLAGMTMVANVLTQCEAGRSEIEAIAPNG